MEVSRNHVAIAIGAGMLIVMVFLGYLMWLNNQGPVLARSEDHDPLSGIPNSIKLNPLRDRTSERAAGQFIRAMRDGQCEDELNKWEKDYRKKYAKFICDSEAQHPLVSWQLVEWEDTPPLRILHYRAQRKNAPDQAATCKELFSVTLEQKTGDWAVTKYDAMY